MILVQYAVERVHLADVPGGIAETVEGELYGGHGRIELGDYLLDLGLAVPALDRSIRVLGQDLSLDPRGQLELFFL